MADLKAELVDCVRAKLLVWVGHVAHSQPDYSAMDAEVTKLATEIVDDVLGAQ